MRRAGGEAMKEVLTSERRLDLEVSDRGMERYGRDAEADLISCAARRLFISLEKPSVQVLISPTWSCSSVAQLRAVSAGREETEDIMDTAGNDLSKSGTTSSLHV